LRARNFLWMRTASVGNTLQKKGKLHFVIFILYKIRVISLRFYIRFAEFRGSGISAAYIAAPSRSSWP